MKAAEPDGLHLQLLGGFALRRGDRVVLDRNWPRSRAKALLKLAALAGPVHRERVLDVLWPDLPAAAAAGNLRKNLHHLRAALAAAAVAGDVVVVRDDVVELAPAITVDVAEFRALATTALDGCDCTALDAALGRYGGDLLPEDLYEEWTARPRCELQQLHRRLLVDGARRDDAAGNAARAAQRLQAALDADPLDEEAHRALMLLHLRWGSRHGALRQYQDCARLLCAELGVGPSAETVALRDAALAGAPPDCDPPHVPRPRGGLFGRDAELERAGEALEGAVDGRGGALVIVGPAGIGKSRLAAEITAAGLAVGARVAIGRGFELEAGIAYQPIRDALGVLATESEVAAVLRDTLYAKRLLPGAATGPVPVADPELLESELVDETVHLLTRLASVRPLVVLIEDLHLADEATIRLLHVLGRRFTDCRALLVVTVRDEEVVAGMPADRLVVGLRRHGGVEIGLRPLPDAAIELLVRERFDCEPVEPALLRSVVRAAEGNPLFATELVATLRNTAAARRAGGRWTTGVPGPPPTPAAVRDLVERRLARLDVVARRVVGLASVLGRAFDVRLLERAGAATEGAVVDALDRAIETALVEEEVTGYRFRHELVRAAVYGTLTGSRRRYLHRRVADAMIAAGETDGVGHHLALSDQPWRAVEILADDARRAAALFANSAARRRYEQALGFARTHPGRTEPRLEAALLEESGELLTRSGDAVAGAAHLREALERYQALGDENAVLRTRGKAALGHMVVGDADEAAKLVQSLLGEWERLLTAESAELAVFAPSGALTTLADIRWHSGRHRAALDAAERAVEIAESAGGLEARGRAYESFALACHSLGDWRRGLEYELRRAGLGLPGFSDVVLDAHY